MQNYPIGLYNIVEDETPQLGGTLDSLENDIDNLGDLIHDEDPATDFLIINEDLNKDIIFYVNDGGASVDVLTLKGATDSIQMDTCTASGAQSVALGSSCTATDIYSFSVGAGCESSGTHSFSAGNNCTASGNWSIAAGITSQATGTGTVCIGGLLVSSGDYATRFGYNFTDNTANSFGVGINGLDLLITTGLADFQDTDITTSGTYNTLSIISGAQHVSLSGDGSVDEGLNIDIPKSAGQNFYYGFGAPEDHLFGQAGQLVIYSTGNLITSGTLTAEQLTSTDDATITNDMVIGESLTVNNNEVNQVGLDLHGIDTAGAVPSRGGEIQWWNSATQFGRIFLNADFRLVFNISAQSSFNDEGFAWIELDSGNANFADTEIDKLTLSDTSGQIVQTGTPGQLDVDPYKLVRFGRSTNHADFKVEIFRGNNSSTKNHVFEGTGDSYVSANNGNFGVGTATATTQFSVKEKAGISPIGGFCVKLTNKTGGNTVAGQLVQTNTAVDDSFILSSADETETFGVILDAGISDGSEAWIVVGGIADVAMKDNTAATRGNWVKASDEAGYADSTNATPPGGGSA